MAGIPAGGGIGGINSAQELVTELQKQQIKDPKTSSKSFEEVMSQTAVKENQQPQQVIVAKATDDSMKINATSVQTAQAIQPAQSVTSPALKGLVGSWAKDQGALNQLMNVAMSGQSFSPAQLLTLQSATFKITFELDAMSKLAETTSGAIKTTMQTQV